MRPACPRVLHSSVASCVTHVVRHSVGSSVNIYPYIYRKVKSFFLQTSDVAAQSRSEGFLEPLWEKGDLGWVMPFIMTAAVNTFLIVQQGT